MSSKKRTYGHPTYMRKSNNNENTDFGTSSENIRNKEQEGRTSKKQKCDSSYLSFGFTSVINDKVENECVCFARKFWLLIV